MFLRYYGLREQPFGTTPDPRFLYLSASHREALASLIYGIETGRGFMALIAEPGMGKTTLLFQLMERLRNSARTVFLFQTQGDTREFLSNLIADLGIEPGDRDVSSLQRQLNEILIQEARLGKQFVLVVDEAQHLDRSVLESVRMLSNFETPRSKLLQIVLAGQPPLADKLARANLEQLRQRVSIICRLNAFTDEEVTHYVRHRLEAAGHKGASLFTPEALAIIADQSGGIPRNINNLCFHALSLGYAQGQKKISGAIMVEVLNDLNLDTLRTARPSAPAGCQETPKPASDIEEVRIRGASRAVSELRYGGASSPLSARRARVSGIRSSTGNPRWLLWAVTMLTCLLAGEAFWAYMPVDSPRNVIAQSLSAVVRKATEVAVKHNLLSPPTKGGSRAAPQPQPQFVAPDNKNTGTTQAITPNEPGDSANIPPEEQKPAGASGELTVAPDANSQVSPKTPEQSGMGGTPGVKMPDHPSTNNAGPSSQVEKGKVVIESNVGGGSITINGQTQTGWWTPHVFSLPPGTYRISVSKEGYSTWFKYVRVAQGEKKWVMADLRLPRGLVVIDTRPPGMQVFIDGKSYGPSEVEVNLSVGAHTYKVIPPPGQQPFVGSFVLNAGDILTRTIRWLPSTGQPEAKNNISSSKREHEKNPTSWREKS